MNRPAIRTALIGYGFAGKTFHAPLIRCVDGFDLRVVASSDADKVQRDLGAVVVLADPLAAFTRDDVDLVVIATPNATHAPLAQAALEAGKHVVVDKPFTITADQARRLNETAQRGSRLLSPFHNRRWDSDFLSLQNLIAQQRLGRIVQFASRIDRYRPEVRQRWREQIVPGGGLLYDLGPHLIDQTLQLFGLPEKVIASTAQQRDGALIDDWFHLVFEYGRARAILQCGMLAAAPTPRFEVHGTRGSWIKYGMDSQEDALRAGRLPGGEQWGQDPSPGLFYDENGTNQSVGSIPGDYREYYRKLRDAITGTAPNPVSALHGIAVMAVLEAAALSAANACAQCVVLSDEERLGYKSAA